jgi:hypothetical protein
VHAREATEESRRNQTELMNGASPMNEASDEYECARGRSDSMRTFFSFHSARRPTPETLTILKRTPGISPLALPRRPKPEMRTSSFSSTKLRQPSFYKIVLSPGSQNSSGARRTGTKAVTFLPFLMSCTRTHLRMAELGCLASTPTFSSTMPLAWDEPPVGDVLKMLPSARFL